MTPSQLIPQLDQLSAQVPRTLVNYHVGDDIVSVRVTPKTNLARDFAGSIGVIYVDDSVGVGAEGFDPRLVSAFRDEGLALVGSGINTIGDLLRPLNRIPRYWKLVMIGAPRSRLPEWKTCLERGPLAIVEHRNPGRGG